MREPTSCPRRPARGILPVMSEIHPPAVGERAPDFTLLDASGTPRSLAALCADRPMVLVFYRGHW
jgi:hypothetical protein